MRFTMQLDMDNAAFADDDAPAELARILRVVAVQASQAVGGALCDGSTQRSCMDLNGNRVGHWRVERPSGKREQ